MISAVDEIEKWQCGVDGSCLITCNDAKLTLSLLCRICQKSRVALIADLCQAIKDLAKMNWNVRYWYGVTYKNIGTMGHGDHKIRVQLEIIRDTRLRLPCKEGGGGVTRMHYGCINIISTKLQQIILLGQEFHPFFPTDNKNAKKTLHAQNFNQEH